MAIRLRAQKTALLFYAYLTAGEGSWLVWSLNAPLASPSPSLPLLLLVYHGFDLWHVLFLSLLSYLNQTLWISSF